MPLLNFPILPNDGYVAEHVEQRTHSISFGDGYSQRAKAGINHRRRSWSVRYGLNDAQKTAAKAFLDARAEVEAFRWKNCTDGETYTVLAEPYQLSKAAPGLWLIDVRLNEAFDV